MDETDSPAAWPWETLGGIRREEEEEEDVEVEVESNDSDDDG